LRFTLLLSAKKAQNVTVQRADAPVTVAANDIDVYATNAKVSGTINDAESVSSPKLAYRAKGASSWTEASTSESGTTLSANLSGLSDNTTYELAAIDNGKVVSVIKTFTTEEARSTPQTPTWKIGIVKIAA